MVLFKEKMDLIVVERLHITDKKIKLEDWENFVEAIKNPADEVEIAVCGKYIEHSDAYKSIMESFVHAGAENNAKVKVRRIRAEAFEEEQPEKLLKGVNGILIPGGFGERGIEGKINAIRYARENNIPFFGICLGLQCAIIEFARNVCGMKKAHSSEFKKTKFSVIDLMTEQKSIKNMGATMRLGAYPCIIQSGTNAHTAYKTDYISERHRHRYEVNNKFRRTFTEHGMIFSGLSPDRELVEMIEIPEVIYRYSKEVKEVNKSLGEFEQIKRFRLVTEEWTPATGELSPTLKLKRNYLAIEYKDIINEIYFGGDKNFNILLMIRNGIDSVLKNLPRF